MAPLPLGDSCREALTFAPPLRQASPRLRVDQLHVGRDPAVAAAVACVQAAVLAGLPEEDDGYAAPRFGVGGAERLRQRSPKSKLPGPESHSKARIQVTSSWVARPAATGWPRL